jgi:septal ring factor EnvC (AmiA/AmiB activator)
MHFNKKKIVPFFLVLVTLVACGDTKMSAEEQSRVNEMDSTETNVQQRTKALEDQTKKVEESLEKLDNEFSTTTKKD